MIVQLQGIFKTQATVYAYADTDCRAKISVRLDCGDFVVPAVQYNHPLRGNLAAFVQFDSKRCNVFWHEDNQKRVWLTVGCVPIKPGETLYLDNPFDDEEAYDSEGASDSASE